MIVLLGGGGHASDVLAVIEARQALGESFGEILVADDHWSQPERFMDRTELKMVESIHAGARLGPVVVCVAQPRTRRLVFEVAAGLQATSAAPLVHPTASIGRGLQAGLGVVVFSHVSLSPKVTLGQHVHVGQGAIVGPDAKIGAFSAIMGGASIGTDVTVGDGVLVGANSVIMPGITIGEGATVTPGAVVTKDLSPRMTVKGLQAV